MRLFKKGLCVLTATLMWLTMCNGVLGFAVGMTDAEAVSAAKANLTLQGIDDMIETNLTLPATGDNGTIITWKSNNTTVLTNSGVILKRPSYDAGATTVPLIAIISKNAESDTKLFNIRIKPTTNLVENYGFETDTTGWSFSDWPSTPTISTDVSHSGVRSLMLPAKTTGSGYLYYAKAPTLKANTKYFFSVWGKLGTLSNKDVNPAPVPVLRYYLQTSGMTIQSDYTKTTYLYLTDQWVEMKATYLIGKDPLPPGDNLRIYEWSQSGVFTAYLDDVCIETYMPATINLEGKTSLNIPMGENTVSENYTYSILNQFGTTDGVTDETAKWSVLGDNLQGVSIDPLTGALTVGSNAVAGIIKVRATSNSYPTWHYKELSVGLKNMPEMVPVAKNVKITKSTSQDSATSCVLGDTLSASYEYSDDNNDAESTSEYRWVAVDEKGNVTELENGTAKAGQTITYSVQETDKTELVDQSIKFVITPKSVVSTRVSTAPTDGLPTESNAVLVRTVPVANNVAISGSLSAGSRITGVYEYVQKNHSLQGASEFRWLKGNDVIATTRDYTVSPGDQGQTLTFEVIPVAVDEPYRGLPATASVNIPYAQRGGGSGGGRTVTSSSIGIVPIPTPPPTPVSDKPSGFADLNGHWSKSDVEKMTQGGYVKGKDTLMFAPDENITRAEFAAIIVRVLGLPKAAYNNAFDDVLSNEWYANDVQTALDNGLITGFDGKFRPNDHVSRQELAKIIVEAYKKMFTELPNGTAASFADEGDADSWARDYILVAKELVFIDGVGDNLFAPKNGATRAQATVIAKRLLDKKSK